jgi:2-polyprenyl-3-methyl-5-hydroxy-6-metoxy-1,4-benzoquinol methylase
VDLSELRQGRSNERHPWEVARAAAIIAILRRHGSGFDSVLDYGCGDGFTGQQVQSEFRAPLLVGVDIHLPPASCGTFQAGPGRYELIQDEAMLGERRFELALLCDVIEHVEDDVGLLRSLASNRVRAGGLMLVTVPAFQALFSRHDELLRHFRRYTLGQLRASAREAGLSILDDGYLFGSLLLPRVTAKVADRFRPRDQNEDFGIGGWRGGPGLTRVLTHVMALDNALLLAARRLGLLIPGLTAWALCKTQSS